MATADQHNGVENRTHPLDSVPATPPSANLGNFLSGNPKRLLLAQLFSISGSSIQDLTDIARVVLPRRLPRHPQTLANLLPRRPLTSRLCYPVAQKRLEFGSSTGQLPQCLEWLAGKRVTIDDLHGLSG